MFDFEFCFLITFGINIIIMPVTSHYSNIICWFPMVTCGALSNDVGVGTVR